MAGSSPRAMDKAMTQYISPQLSQEILQAADGKCQCDGEAGTYLFGKCDHEPGACERVPQGTCIAIPSGAKEIEYEAVGRAFCESCFPLSHSYQEQNAWQRPRFLPPS